MTDADRKILTEEVLGEKFSPGLVGLPYQFEGDVYSNRSFITPADVFSVKGAIVRMGKWATLCDYALDKYYETHNRAENICDTFDFFEWLFRTVNEKGDSHFCQLAVDWWKSDRP